MKNIFLSIISFCIFLQGFSQMTISNLEIANKFYKNQNELYLPKGCTSLWNSHQRALNFHGIKEGSQVSVTYNFELTTYSSNTEVWLRTYFASNDQEFVQFVGSLKYQNTYNLSVTQNIFIEDKAMWGNGAIPQIRTDFDASVILNSVYVSVV